MILHTCKAGLDTIGLTADALLNCSEKYERLEEKKELVEDALGIDC